MQDATSEVPGLERTEGRSSKKGPCASFPGMGTAQALERLAKSFKARKTVRLAVAGAFHTPYMQPAEEQLRCEGFEGLSGFKGLGWF